MPPPPPPAPGPPPPGKMPPKAAGGRKDLLGSIEGFKKGKLKKAETVDKSGPALAGKKMNQNLLYYLILCTYIFFFMLSTKA